MNSTLDKDVIKLQTSVDNRDQEIQDLNGQIALKNNEIVRLTNQVNKSTNLAITELKKQFSLANARHEKKNVSAIRTALKLVSVSALKNLFRRLDPKHWQVIASLINSKN